MASVFRADCRICLSKGLDPNGEKPRGTHNAEHYAMQTGQRALKINSRATSAALPRLFFLLSFPPLPTLPSAPRLLLLLPLSLSLSSLSSRISSLRRELLRCTCVQRGEGS